MTQETGLRPDQLTLLKSHSILLQGEVNEKMLYYVDAALSILEKEGSPAVTIEITSTGGSCPAGLYIASRILNYTGPTTAMVPIFAVSAAVSILLACDYRFCAHTAFIHAHESRVTWENIPCSSLRDPDFLKRLVSDALHDEGQIESMYSARTGLSLEETRKLLIADERLSAKQAEELGFVHELY